MLKKLIAVAGAAAALWAAIAQVVPDIKRYLRIRAM
jgi:hypothetical protein